MRTLFCLALTVGLVGAGASPAFAAKGVKKNDVNGVHELHGVVTHIEHQKGKNGNGQIGEITIKANHTKKKAGAASVKECSHKVTVTKNTHVAHVHGQLQQPAAFGDVHVGHHVTIKVKQEGHADSVAIHVPLIKQKAVRIRVKK